MPVLFEDEEEMQGDARIVLTIMKDMTEDERASFIQDSIIPMRYITRLSRLLSHYGDKVYVVLSYARHYLIEGE